MENEGGSLNFDKSLQDPFTGAPVASWYKQQTYDAVFGSLSSPLEECRAESVGIYLCLNKELLSILPISDYSFWIHYGRGRFASLSFFGPRKKIGVLHPCLHLPFYFEIVGKICGFSFRSANFAANNVADRRVTLWFFRFSETFRGAHHFM